MSTNEYLAAVLVTDRLREARERAAREILVASLQPALRVRFGLALIQLGQRLVRLGRRLALGPHASPARLSPSSRAV